MLKSNLSTLLLFFCILITISGCDSGITGNLVENKTPVTNLTVESINRGEDFRLSSQINISWWGSDPDGYVVGFEYAINDTSEGAWKFTTKSDSTFILPIDGGQNTDDVLFKVRAVDNDGAKDPKGARLIYPIVNTAPEVSFNINETPPDTLFAISSFGWTVSDPDGFLNISRTEVAINDTVSGWVEIPLPDEGDGRVFISLEYDNSTTGIKDANVFLGRSYTSALNNSGGLLTVPGIEVGEKNIAYIRSIDAAGAISEVDTVSWFVKPQYSKVLFINDIEGNAALTKQNQHLTYLDANGIVPDVWLINSGTGLSDAFPSVIDPTLQKTLAKWDHIYWVSNSIARNITFALEITNQFFAEGGTMFVNIPMVVNEVNQDLELFNFLPVDSIGYVDATKFESGFVINNNTEVTASVNGAPNLLTQIRQTGVYPLKPLPGATLLYETDFKASTVLGGLNDYTKFEGVGVENSEGSLIYYGMDITILNGNGNLNDFISYVCVQRLGFSN